MTLSPCRAETGMAVTSLQAELPGHRRVAVDDRGEAVFAVAHQVHLVDREHDAADAHQRHDGAVPKGLRQQALGGVDQDDREVGGRGARRHVARVLLVARRVGDDEAPPRRREIAVADVDGDALLAFRLQAVDQAREIGAAAARRSSGTTSASTRSRPISVLLPSSTLPQAMKRSRLASGPASIRSSLRPSCAPSSPRRGRWRGPGARRCASGRSSSMIAATVSARDSMAPVSG